MKKLIIPFFSILALTFLASCASDEPVTQQTTTTTRQTTVTQPTATQTTTTHSSTNY